MDRTGRSGPRAAEVAIVTGGAGGLGSAIARRLAQDDVSVAILDRDREAAMGAAAALAAAGARAIAIGCDVTQRDEVKSAVARVRAELGDPSILVNNAGIGRRAPFLELSEETWNEVLSVNLTGPFIVAQEVCRVMAERGRGWVVNMGSVASHVSHSEQVAYSTSKAGIEALTRVMAFELAPLGIRVNAVAPGTIATGIIKGMLTEQARTEREKRIPVGRLGTPEEIADVVAFLASEGARYMSGSIVVADGGLLFAGIRT